jgi:hypothetical protein
MVAKSPPRCNGTKAEPIRRSILEFVYSICTFYLRIAGERMRDYFPSAKVP